MKERITAQAGVRAVADFGLGPSRILRESYVQVLQRQPRFLDVDTDPRRLKANTRPHGRASNRLDHKGARASQISAQRGSSSFDDLLPRSLHVKQCAQIADRIG